MSPSAWPVLTPPFWFKGPRGVVNCHDPTNSPHCSRVCIPPITTIYSLFYSKLGFFSHTVGGVLGVASRITGTMGKGIASLTFDEEYQRRRMQARQQTGSFGEGMFRGMRGVVAGVSEGVTGGQNTSGLSTKKHSKCDF